MEFKDHNPEQKEEVKALAEEEALDLSDDTLDDISGGNTYTSMDGYEVDDGLDSETLDTIRMYLQ